MSRARRCTVPRTGTSAGRRTGLIESTRRTCGRRSSRTRWRLPLEPLPESPPPEVENPPDWVRDLGLLVGDEFAKAVGSDASRPLHEPPDQPHRLLVSVGVEVAKEDGDV